jgi:pimeloyl-ACP methyl ester carboxylesterase
MGPMPDLSQSSAQVDGLRVSYLSGGTPVLGTLLFLHGSGLTARTWTAVMGLLGPEYRCIAPDLRGHGDSEWPVKADYALADFGSDATGLLGQLDVPRPVLVGMSLGGLVALHMVAGGFDAQALVLVDSGPRMAGRQDNAVPAFLRRRTYPSLEDVVAAAMAFNPRRSAELLRISLPKNMTRSATGEWSWKWDPRRLQRVPARRAEADALWARLPSVGCPSLVVRGADSETFPQATAEELCAALPRCVLETVNDAGHNVPGDNAAGLSTSIRRFLREIAAPG